MGGRGWGLFEFLWRDPTRLLEVSQGFLTLLFGIWLMFVIETFSSTQTYALAARIAPGQWWGACFAGVALFQLFGVFLNVMALRLLGVLVIGALWGVLAWAAAIANLPSTGVLLFGFVAFKAAFLACRLTYTVITEWVHGD